jgi:hypothetical protein
MTTAANAIDAYSALIAYPSRSNKILRLFNVHKPIRRYLFGSVRLSHNVFPDEVWLEATHL